MIIDISGSYFLKNKNITELVLLFCCLRIINLAEDSGRIAWGRIFE